jgi:AraC family transcriptional regulator
MRQENPEHGSPLGPLAALRKILPFEPAAASDRLGWVGLEAARYRAAPAAELNPPALTHHRLVLFTRPPEELDLRYEGVKRFVPPPAGAIALVPAGIPVLWRWSGCFDWLHIFLEPGLVARVAAEAFDLDPSRLTISPLDALDLPHLRAAMRAVDAELNASGAGGRLAAESLVNVLAVHLIRHVLAPHRPARGRDGTLPRGRFRAVIEYIEEHLDASPTLEQMAAVARLSSYHFARQFKSATGLPPHQYVIARRVERARHPSRQKPTFPLRRSPHTPGSRTRASSPITSSAWWASRLGSSGHPQESPDRPQVPPRNSRAPPLPFPMSRGLILVSRRQASASRS